MNFWILVYRLAWMVVVASGVVAIVCIFLPKTHNYQTLQNRKEALEQANEATEARIRKLNLNQKRFRSDPEFVERSAREQGMAKPGETIFRFPATNMPSKSIRP
jgi:cell division protein FtsB